MAVYRLPDKFYRKKFFIESTLKTITRDSMHKIKPSFNIVVKKSVSKIFVASFSLQCQGEIIVMPKLNNTFTESPGYIPHVFACGINYYMWDKLLHVG